MRRQRRTRVWGGVLFAVLWGVSGQAMVWPNAIERLERAFEQGDVGQRRTAAQRLTRVPESALDRLLPLALRDDDAEVRMRSAQVAIEARFAPARFEALQWLSDADPMVRRAAAEVLGAFAIEPAALQALGRALGDAELDVRLAAVRALGDSAEPEAALALLGHIDDGSAQLQVAVIRALAKIGDARSVVPLIGKVQDARAAVRRAAATALGVLGGERVVSALVLALDDSDARVRLAAVNALGKQRSDESVDALLSAADDDEQEVRIAAVNALGDVRSQRAASLLVELLAHQRIELREASERALASMGGVAVGPLRACLQAGAQPVRLDGCARALARAAEGKATSAIAEAWRAKTISAEAALQALSSSRDEQALPLVLEALLNEDPWVRRQAVEAAWQLLDPTTPDGRAVEPILKALEREQLEREERLSLVALLGRTGSERARAELTRYAAPGSPLAFRVAAVQGLGWVSPDEASERQLLAALADTDERLRWEAALAVRRTGRGRLVEPLLEQLDTQPVSARELSLLALWGPVAQRTESALAERLERRVRAADGAERDALIDVLLRMPGSAPRASAERLLEGASGATRVKLAEAFSGKPWARPALRRLVVDSGAAVRANAVWSLGRAGEADDVELLLPLISDRDISVAANAVVAATRLADQSQRAEVVAALCQALPAAAAYVRINALLGLTHLGAECDGETAVWLLTQHPVPLVRQAAAAHLYASQSRSNSAGSALRRCATHDIDADVARACEAGPPWQAQEANPVTVFVVPDSKARPAPLAPFALRLGDGFLRLGWADHRGAVSEYAPTGPVRLEVPAQLVE